MPAVSGAISGVVRNIEEAVGVGSETCTVANYLLTRLKELGCSTVFGVPGDFNLEFLDSVEDFEGINWGYNTSELAAGYAADGYARVRGIAALCTTFGVGELSAINAQAGSFAEMVPVVHIVGTPSTVSQANGAILHHSLGNGDFRVFYRMFQEVTVAQAMLRPDNAASEIDRVIRECFMRRRPVYIGLPSDVANQKIKVDMKPLDVTPPENPRNAEAEVVDRILDVVNKAKNPAILIDGCAQRFHIEKEIRDFVDASGLPVYESPMGKAVLSEFHKQFRGVYLGELTPEPVKSEVNNVDVLIRIGAIKSDFNTGGFTMQISKDKQIELHSDHTMIFHARWENVGFRGVLKELAKRIQARAWTLPPPKFLGTQGLHTDSTDEIQHGYFWNALGSYFANDPHIVTVETGTSSFGTSLQRLAEGSIYISQVLWGSIGFATAAALGASIAGRELGRPKRTVLVTGDGSFQMTATDLSTFLRHKLTPIIIIINNDGYTIERYIHGENRNYNHTMMWNYAKSLEYFAVPSQRDMQPAFGLQSRIQTKSEVEPALRQAFAETDKIHILEIIMPKLDAPIGMVKTAEKTAAENKVTSA
ncbi:Pyruvate decarboxylase 1 [Gaertneriomyces sp. JEL0708]|nr:Pyruvate decarboxylase 1 [Gaertneriomyces sp. JEL0708]